MKTIFDTLFASSSEFEYFKKLKSREQLQYFFELYDANIQRSTGTLDLKAFFESVRDTLINESNTDTTSIQTIPDHNEKSDRIDIIIDSENILIESNSLRAIRHVINKFVESGYILKRDVVMEKTFRRDKITRYMRIFKIIDQITPICLN